MPEEYPLFTPTSDDRVLAMLSHLLTLIGGFIAPLIIWLIKKDDHNASFVTENAKESLNFQITVFILSIVCVILVFVLIGIILIWALGITDLVLVIIATVRSNEGKLYRYPINFRLIK
ncbi:MAG TPA: DUF4870 domain-containing protein [Puia sp.]|nr:DUF4870 domain-containing protein [Puia sp.]